MRLCKWMRARKLCLCGSAYIFMQRVDGSKVMSALSDGDVGASCTEVIDEEDLKLSRKIKKKKTMKVSSKTEKR